MRPGLAAARLGATHRFTWRLEVVVAALSALAVVVVNASLWIAAADHGPVAGLAKPALGTYVVVAWLVAVAVGGRVEEWVGERFYTGAIASDLVRPMDLHAWALARHLGRSAASMLHTAVPVFAVMGLWFPVALPRHLVTWGLFAVSVSLAAVVGGQIGFLVGLLAFRLGRVTGVAHLKAAAVWLLSGAMIPIFALPVRVQDLVAVLPFQALAHVPAVLFTERVTGPEAFGLLGLQAFWALLLWGACRLGWAWAQRRIVVWGG